MKIEDRIEKANEISNSIAANYSFWDANVWQKNDMVRVYVNFNGRQVGFIDITDAGVKSNMKTLRDNNRIEEILN